MSTTKGKPSPQMPTFEKTALPDFSLANPLGSGSKFISTAACLVIGDEVLNGKTKDSNSNYFARFCFDLGIELKRIEVVADDEETMIEAARRLTAQHDLVVSSGGIGPTPDDITYQSMAKAFSEAGELVYDQEVIRRMEENSKVRQVNTNDITNEILSARNRMALLPKQNAETIFPTTTLWVPIVRMAGKLYILPGVPKLFETLLENMRDYIPLDPNHPKPYRVLIHTHLPESNISPFLVKLSEKCREMHIKVGSYPKWNNGVDVSLIGKDWSELQKLIPEVQEAVQGKLIESTQLGNRRGTEKLSQQHRM
ncbi:related to 3^-phosphoadenosine 5^-phosphosulfate sulfotransferase (PAPS reductase)/FAD synthetase and related enzymes [Ustilago bromivora]|uniref:Related to 3^-phosphoadenosine 5^-phosphosulfate sulfotransferase (PAPS reductase)/FAD synthetase and related enzymes n=1 Tax=Ustilago bromivora TaxID=307758 RepID=A0A1K0GED7_9BASI|nr:related to 3^-phosphoadenosine 5^-phosphosulfate sulfotransferase (PAPS reductase)/FAD synthetase and related enzymes [Ustilago bromivora]SYW80160.1 related to 3^-phosphoadenosine 5^-phosphosulfate sulfotransferase (PAPS reductase)/FAD synthetase and related enzymes [Ustilago bromivora]